MDHFIVSLNAVMPTFWQPAFYSDILALSAQSF